MFKNKVLILLSVMLVLCSCSVQKQEQNDTTQNSSVSPAEEALVKMEKAPVYPEGYPSLDDVVSQYKRTCQAIGWIVGTELVATDADYTYEAHGMKYYHSSEKSMSYDDMGDTGMAMIENFMADDEAGRNLRPIWAKIRSEE